ncbi:MAG: glycine zipper 2TM domain-containing protein [Pseudomonadales bacterium]
MSVRRTIGTVLLTPSLVLSGALLPQAASAGVSMDKAKVLSADPVYRTVSVSVPREQCSLVEEAVPSTPRYRSYTGPILGAIIGGAIGNAVGHNKTNKKVGTAVGAVLGGTIGRDIQHRSQQSRYDDYGYQGVRYETREVCHTVYDVEQHEELDGYDVTYRYAGETFTTRMDHDPGRFLTVRVQVTPV